MWSRGPATNCSLPRPSRDSPSLNALEQLVAQPPRSPLDSLFCDPDFEARDVQSIADPLEDRPALELVPGEGRPHNAQHQKVEEQISVGTLATGCGPTVVGVQQQPQHAIIPLAVMGEAHQGRARHPPPVAG